MSATPPIHTSELVARIGGRYEGYREIGAAGGRFDLIYGMSVFTHIMHKWSHGLERLIHRQEALGEELPQGGEQLALAREQLNQPQAVAARARDDVASLQAFRAAMTIVRGKS